MNISVIIPCYNAERTIINTLKSVLCQTVPPSEIIIVNDGSSDKSEEIINDFISENKSIQIQLITKENGGVSSARNIGMKSASGEWIALLDSDDEWLPTKLERQIEVLRTMPEIDFLGCNRNGERYDTFLGLKFKRLTRVAAKTFLLKNFFPVPTVIFKKSILDTVGFFDERQRYAEEGNYFIRIANKHNVYLLNESLVITGDGKPDFGHSGLSGNLWEMEKGELKNIQVCLNLKIISSIEFPFCITFSILKFIRRLLIVKLR